MCWEVRGLSWGNPPFVVVLGCWVVYNEIIDYPDRERHAMIIYFSATGNCKYVADRIADKLRIKAVSWAECGSEIQLSKSEIFGFVSPTYHWGLPSVVKEYLENITFTGAAEYSFFITTYGTMSGRSGTFAERYLSEKGLGLDAKFGVKMPDTWTPMFDLSNHNKVAKINQNEEPQIDEIIRHITARDSGDFIKAKVPMFVVKIYNPTYEKDRETKHLNLLDSCIGCGLCAKQCPVHAIEMRDKKPVWVKEKCAMCLGCLHHCPKFSIQYDNRTAKHGQYTHPPYTPAG